MAAMKMTKPMWSAAVVAAVASLMALAATPAEAVRCPNNQELCWATNQCVPERNSNVPNCEEVNPCNPAVCLECDDNYELTSTQSCQRQPYDGQTTKTCPDNECKKCLASDTSKCTKCHDGYEVCWETGKCVAERNAAVPHCENVNPCNTAVCIDCDDGYYVTLAGACEWKKYNGNNGGNGGGQTGGNSPVSSCGVDNCYRCWSGTSSCVACRNGYELCWSSGECVAKRNAAVPNCKEVNPCEPTTCLECDDNYELTSAGKCEAKGSSGQTTKTGCTDANCKKCLSSDPSKCVDCRDDYEVCWATKKCVAERNAAVPNCEEVNPCDPSVCIDCDDGYYVTSTGSCERKNIIKGGGSGSSVACSVANCHHCASGTSLCEACNNGYQLCWSTGECVAKRNAAVANCNTVNPCNPAVCTDCNDGYELTGTGECAERPASAATTKSGCTAANCKECLASDLSVCVDCKDDYDVCWSTGRCAAERTDALPNCEEANPCNPSMCADCDNGFYLTASSSCGLTVESYGATGFGEEAASMPGTDAARGAASAAVAAGVAALVAVAAAL